MNAFVFMVDQEDKNQLPWWQPGVQLFSEVSTWIAGPIIGALILGKWLDGRYGTEPKLFLICAALGFFITIYGIVKVVRAYQKKIKNSNGE